MFKTKSQKNLLLLVSLLIFYLNDLLFIFNPSKLVFYLSDYFFKGLIFAGIIIVIKSNKEEFVLLKVSKRGISLTIYWTIFLVVAGVIIDQLVWRILYDVLPKIDWQLGFPTLSNPFFIIFDLTIGIFIVAFTEEYIFRYLLVDKLRNKLSLVCAAFISLVMFSLAHWSFGLTALFSTFLWAFLPLVSVLRLRSLLPAMISHYLTDLISFSGIVDKLVDALI